MFSTGRLSSEVPYPFITIFHEKDTPFGRSLQVYLFVKKEIFYTKKQLFYKNIFCKKAAFVHKKATFLQKYIFVKKQYFYNRLGTGQKV